MSKNKRCPNLCNQVAELPCLCCGVDNHHQDCSVCDCEKYWKIREENRLGEIKRWNESRQSSLKKELEEELVNLKKYRDEKMVSDTTIPADIKAHIIKHIAFLEREIPKRKDQQDWERHVLTELERYKPEVYYSKHRPVNTNCPHWRKYAQQASQNENNERSNRQGGFGNSYSSGGNSSRGITSQQQITSRNSSPKEQQISGGEQKHSSASFQYNSRDNSELSPETPIVGSEVNLGTVDVVNSPQPRKHFPWLAVVIPVGVLVGFLVLITPNFFSKKLKGITRYYL